MDNWEKQQKQDAFWRNLVQKYEGRASGLQSQICAGGVKDTAESLGCCCTTSAVSDEPNEVCDTFSMSSADLKRMMQVKELVEHNKQLQHKLQQKKIREKNYECELKKKDEKMAAKEKTMAECLCLDPVEDDEEKIKNELLMKENKRLTDELLDLKIQMKNCVDRIEGPIIEQIKRERCRAKCLEREIELAKSAANSPDNPDLALNQQLAQAMLTIDKLTKQNGKLKEEMCEVCCKYNEMKEMVAKQKADQSEVVRQMVDANNRKACVCNRENGKNGKEAGAEDPKISEIAGMLVESLRDACKCTCPPK